MLLQAALSKTFILSRSKSCSALKIGRLFSTKTILAEKLEKRGLLKITGKDCRDFLQGLTTNDVRHLADGNETSVSLPCIYSMILNVQGRLLYDVFIYKVKESSPIGDCLLLECDAEIKEDLAKHLSKFKLRKKVDVNSMHDLAVYSLFSPTDSVQSEIPTTLETDDRVVTISRDPRVSELGHRLIVASSKEITDITDTIEVTHGSKGKYRDLRYSLGVGEGVYEYPPGECFPLECNGDYLHGISFTKGCYLGQELTSRIYHTGVIRKRIMPFKFNNAEVQYKEIPINCAVVNEEEKNVGKFRSCGPAFGIGLLRIEQVLAAKTLLIKGFGQITTHKPIWWPQGT